MADHDPEQPAPVVQTRLGTDMTLLAVLILVGAALRIWRATLAGLPMRIDEVRVAVNLQQRTYAELALPLDHQQGAPVGFLWLCKLAVQLFGEVDVSYRLVPLLAGIGVVVLVPLLARRVVGRGGVVLATALAALAPWGVQYSSDLKQYSMDALATAAVLLAAFYALPRDAAWRSRAVFAAIGALAIVCSHAAMFVTAAAGLTLGLVALWRRQGSAIAQLLGVALAWAGTFAGLWFINLRHISGRGDLMDFWAQDFMPLPPTSAAEWGWYARAPMEWLNTSGYYFNPAVLLLAAVGVWALRRKPAVAGLLLGPAIVTLAASAAEQYPFANRMIAFLMPATILLLAVGYDTLARAIAYRLNHKKPAASRSNAAGSPASRSARAPLAAVLLALLCFLATLPFSQLARPWMGGRFDLVRPMQVIHDNRRDGDLIILGNAMWWPYRHWYAPRMGLPHEYDRERFLNQRMPRDAGDEYADALKQKINAHAPRRVWVLAADGIWMGHHPKWPTLGDMHDTRAPTRDFLEQLGTIEQQHDYANVSVYLLVPNGAEQDP